MAQRPAELSSAGRGQRAGSLREDVKTLTNHSGSLNYVDIPVYLMGCVQPAECIDSHSHQTLQ